jgi:two-component system chemotaxis response regulator CheY
MQILIAEDVTLIQKMLQKMLGPYGEITFVRSGREAFQKFQRTLTTQEYFDLICLDINIPEINGLDVLKNIRAAEKLNHVPLDKRAKIVIVSSTNEADVVMKAIKLGCDGYIVKPFSQEKIIAELKKLKLITEEKKAPNDEEKPPSETEKQKSEDEAVKDKS